MEYIKSQLIEVLKASQDIGFRESYYPDNELISLLKAIADEYGIAPSEYTEEDDE